MPPPSAVPVTVLTGFLGSGKTTLVNHLLQGDHGRRVAVLLNEFGAIGIDHHLIARRDADVVELTNGCLCCTVRDDLLQSIAPLLMRLPRPDHVVIETTGLADPAPVVAQLLDPRVQAVLRPDAVVTLVDAAHFDHNLDYAPQAYHQIVYADILLINKADLVTRDVLDHIEAGVRRLNPRARVLRCIRAQIDPAVILDVDLSPATSVRQAPPTGGHGHAHLAEFETVSFQITGPVTLPQLVAFLEESPSQVFRGKGVVDIVDLPYRLVFHLVGGRWTVIAGHPWTPEEPRSTEMVFIGKALAEDDLRQRWHRSTDPEAL